ncbi:hypothetical protein AeMF1_012624 [Aphanomyces euteiches]|nr:hypothetical protein AeMF1_012624 [Aphanomyces euteiches]
MHQPHTLASASFPTGLHTPTQRWFPQSSDSDTNADVQSTAVVTPQTNRYRVSPYPERVRTPVQLLSPAHSQPSSATPLYELLLRPIIKSTVGQRDTSGDTLDDVVFTGTSFKDIMSKFWEQFRPRIKCRAVKTDGVWTAMTDLGVTEWTKSMQFKWLGKLRGHTVVLLVYTYGTAIAKGQDLEEFSIACIRPEQSDRAGATAESSLHEIVDKLQERWGTIFSAEAVVWRMWANDVTRNLNRLTWDDAINQLPSNYISSLLRPVDSHFQHHFQNLFRSTSVALDCVKASIADNEQLLSEWEAFGHRLKMQKEQLQSRKLIIEASIRDLPPPGLNAVVDPLAALDNIDDEEHKDED